MTNKYGCGYRLLASIAALEAMMELKCRPRFTSAESSERQHFNVRRTGASASSCITVAVCTNLATGPGKLQTGYQPGVRTANNLITG